MIPFFWGGDLKTMARLLIGVGRPDTSGWTRYLPMSLDSRLKWRKIKCDTIIEFLSTLLSYSLLIEASADGGEVAIVYLFLCYAVHVVRFMWRFYLLNFGESHRQRKTAGWPCLVKLYHSIEGGLSQKLDQVLKPPPLNSLQDQFQQTFIWSFHLWLAKCDEFFQLLMSTTKS
jgi:hypothetical protein